MVYEYDRDSEMVLTRDKKKPFPEVISLNKRISELSFFTDDVRFIYAVRRV